MRKALTIVVMLVLFVAIFAGVWWFALRDNTAPQVDGGTPSTRTFNPFGIFDDAPGTTDLPQDSNTLEDTPFADRTARATLVQISNTPTAGATTLEMLVGTSTLELVRYVERETGHIFDYNTDTKNIDRLSNTTVPRVREAVFGNAGNSIALRRIQEDGETIETYFGLVTEKTSTENESRFSGMFLPENILSLVIHPVQHEAFYIVRTDAGGQGYLVSRDGTQNVFSHPFSQWRPTWQSNTALFLTTAPSRSAGGIVFSLNTGTGALTKVSSTTAAPTILPLLNEDFVLLGSVGQAGPHVSVYNVRTGQTTPLFVDTLPEKCVWGGETLLYCAVPSNTSLNLPDDWYQGVVSFSDTLWQINTETGLTTYLLDPSTVIQVGADMINLSITPDGSHLSFINKKDGTLWLVDLSLALSQSNPAGTTSESDF